MIDEKILLERLEEEVNLYCDGVDIGVRRITKIVNQLAEESNKKYEPTMDLLEYGIKGYNHHLKEQYRRGYEDAKRELLGLSDKERVDNLSEQIAVYLTKYGVNITEKLDISVRTAFALDQAYLRGRQDERDKFDKWREENNNGWIPCERELPKIGTCVLVTTESGYVCEEVLIYDYMHSKAKEPCFHRWDDEMWDCYTPIVLAWQPLPPAFKEK